VARIAQRQHGVISLEQLIGVGMNRRTAQERAERGSLHRIHQRVYAVGHGGLTRKGRWMAAVLACGPAAVLSHRSAAAIWGLRSARSGRIDVTASGRRGRSPSGIDAHRDGHLAASDRSVVDGIPCTSVARTLLDLAGVLSPRELENAITQSEIHRIFDLGETQELIRRSSGRRGVARLRLAIETHDPRAERANPGLEREFLRLCRRANLAMPEVNVPVDLPGGHVIADFLWHKQRLIAETDDRASHQTETAFDGDRRRDRHLKLAGWDVIRCTWQQVTREPEELSAELRALLRSKAGRT
jgi:very-short-patch-repair endonuclease